VGESSKDIAARLGCNGSTVGRWRGRFARLGIDGLHDEPRTGRPREIGDAEIERVVKTLEEQPREATHWSLPPVDGPGGYKAHGRGRPVSAPHGAPSSSAATTPPPSQRGAPTG